jgi:DNA oxidative demethylase
MQVPEGFRLLTQYLDRASQDAMLGVVRTVVAEAPFYVAAMPKSGKLLSVRMTNCGPLGWLTDRDGGYRYQATHPGTGRPWPPIPKLLLDLWTDVSGHAAPPEACLINFYAESARMGSHRDVDEQDLSAPVVSVSLGDDAVFHLGGLVRSDPKRRYVLKSGDVVVLGGKARLAYHGVDRVLAGTSDLLPEGGRINLTLRRVRLPVAFPPADGVSG